MRIHTGTSGFSYKEWKGSFYPEDLRPAGMLAWYAGRLGAVEINNTFYRLPKASVLASWAEQVPPHFRFSVKASRRITHFKRLKPEAAGETAYLMETLEALGDRLGAVLFQLPPNMKKDVERLAAFLDTLPSGRPAAFEFRNASWDDDGVRAVLRERGAAWVCSDTEDREDDAPLHDTASWGYLRLRRPSYEEADLERWAARLRGSGWSHAFVFFKHEDEAAGPFMAARFAGMLEPS